MILTFIGKGSCTNTELGNNSAYYKAGSSLLLFDCGCDVFSKLKKEIPIEGGILDGVKDVTILITHMHDDHIGSLASLIFYLKFELGIEPNLVYPNEVELETFLYAIGVRNSMYKFVPSNPERTIGINTDSLYSLIMPIKTEHYKEMSCYGYYVIINGNRLYYSGDTRTIPNTAMGLLENDSLLEFYQDTSGRPVNSNEYYPHMQYGNLVDIIDESLRGKMYLMHQDLDFAILKDIAIEDGFKVV